MIVDIRTNEVFTDAPLDSRRSHDDDPLMTDSAQVRLPEPVLDMPRRNLIGPAIAMLLAATWLIAAFWFVASVIPTLSRVATIQLIAALASVPSLIALGYILVQRTSQAEARRYGATAAAMRAQSVALEHSLGTLSQTLEANRLLIADQAKQLAVLGGEASERLALLSHAMASEMHDAVAHTHRLNETAASARATVDVLLTSLPRARVEAEEVIERMTHTGLVASQHAAALNAQLAALAEQSAKADTAAGGAAVRLAAHIVRMESTSETAGSRLEAVTADMSAAVDALLGRTATAIDQSRQSIVAQGDAMFAMVEINQATLDRAARESADALAVRIKSVDAALNQIGARLSEHRHAGDSFVTSLETGIGRVVGRLAALHDHGVDRTQRLDEAITALVGSAEAMVEAIAAGDTIAKRSIHTTENLLTALDGAVREIDEALPQALARLDARIGASAAIIGETKPELLALVAAAEGTHAVVEAIGSAIVGQHEAADGLTARLVANRVQADGLGARVNDTITDAQRFANEAGPRLIEALQRVNDTAIIAADRARETLGAVIPDAAASLERAAGEALDRAAAIGVERQIAALNEAAAGAVVAAASAGERLASQVQSVADNTALIESRFENARIEREEADTETLARRVGALIEALNSASIDIAKAMAPDVSDTAWAEYLKGDRSVFTRRAVRILNTRETRDVTRLYDGDAGFRDQVNRYIHEFEAMLRAILGQRGGSPLGVTILSSDMGKLYVALAQAIERLR